MLLLEKIAFVSFFMLALDAFHFGQKAFYSGCVLVLVGPIVLLLELEEVLDVALGFFVDGGQTHHAVLHVQ